MSDYFEPSYIEPDSAFTLKDGKATVSIQFSADLLEKAASEIVQNHIEINFMPKLERAVQSFLELKGYSQFDSLIKEVVKEQFEKRYPDVVENKVNQIHDYLLKLRPEDSKDWRWDSTQKTLGEAAKAKVLEYINNELSKEVKVTKEWLETFSRNYFANNLFRAMGMMDKMIPEVIKDGK
jgi:acyl-CoA synthetase (NDP forming)